jgi:catechol 2,3-dioxygenase-like lactoylglutathione lyase family enzyme
MSLHGLANMTLGVPNVADTTEFYRDFGLAETSAGSGVFGSTDGGKQLEVVQRAYRQLVEVTLAVDDVDDIARIRTAAAAQGHTVAENDDGSISIVEPYVNTRFRISITPRIKQDSYVSPVQNAPGRIDRRAERAPAIFHEGPVSPRRLGHVLYGTPDIDGSERFLIDVMGFKMSDTTPGIISFLRCGVDHHNVALAKSPIPFFHHSSWQVDDADAIGNGAHHLLTIDPKRTVWGMGRHFLGSNFFWYFRDPAGNYAEYFADLDQIPEDDVWIAQNWDPSKSLYAWGPPVPGDFVMPNDVEEIAQAMKAAD